MAERNKVELNRQGSVLISPDRFDAVLFDMDGVVTRTAAVHFAAWKKIFNEFLQQRFGENYKPFTQEDYLQYVDGKPREDGVRSFIASRQIQLPETSDDKSEFASVEAIAKKKDEEFLNLIHTKGVEPYETTISLIRSLRSAGIATALVTASKNGAEILRVTKLRHLFDATVDGVDAANLHLHGKPAPDVFLEAARRLSVPPYRAVVVEDAEAGVQSGRNGHFGLVIGVARQHNKEALKEHGADYVVSDLADVTTPQHSDMHKRGLALAEMDVTEANWVVEYKDFDPAQEGRRESLCALGNGKFCTRGAATESERDEVHYPGTYVAGAYNSIWLEVDGNHFEREELVNMPNWLLVTFNIDDGEWFDLRKVEILSYSQRLNLREGILYRDVKFRDSKGRETEMSERRFVHMRFSHMAGLEIRFTPLNWKGKLTIRSAIDGRVVNDLDQIDPRFRRMKHLEIKHKTIHGNIIFMKVQTTETDVIVAQAAKTEISIDDSPTDGQRTPIIEDAFVGQDIVLNVDSGQELRIRKTVSLYTSRDRGIYEAGRTAVEAIQNAPAFDLLIHQQVAAWRSLWRQFDLFLETTEEYSKLIPSLLVHLNSFHVLQTASPHTVDLDTGVPARGWTGEGYQGHIFWDDLFVFPFINLRMPQISAALLKYRYRRLHEARKIARSMGAWGACFPWQSASDGRERTPAYWWMPAKQKWVKDYTHLELHVNGAIAYNVWQYYQVTQDNNFMYSYGSEILLEIARFFATYAKFNKKRQRYEIHGVIGPDEFHNRYPGAEKAGLNNNSYTNLMAVWTLCRALELLKVLPSDHRDHVLARLQITDDELKLWDAVSRKMYLHILDNGVLAEFEGYEDLEEFPWRKDGKIDHDALQKALYENDGYLNQYKISKQADVLMLNYVFTPAEVQDLIERLGYPYKCAAVAENAEYYIPRTANESTLSRVAHAWALSRLDRILSRKLLPHCQIKTTIQTDPEQLFYEALGSDYFDVASRGTTNTGIHMAAMAGTVDIVQRCYTGIATKGDVLWLDPALPEPLLRLSFTLHYRGQSLAIDIHKDKMRVAARHSSAEPIKIGYGKQVYTLNAGDVTFITLVGAKKEEEKRESKAA